MTPGAGADIRRSGVGTAYFSRAAEMADTQVEVDHGDEDGGGSVQNEAGQRQHDAQTCWRVHLKSSTAPYGSAD